MSKNRIAIAVAAVACAVVLLLSIRGTDMEIKGVECQVRVEDKAASPFADRYLRVALCNNTANAIDVKSNLPCGIKGCLDVEVQDANGKRVSRQFYEASIASPFATEKVVATLTPKQDCTVDVSPMRAVQETIGPGRYKCRVRFRYEDIDVTSEFVEFTVTERQIKDAPR